MDQIIKKNGNLEDYSFAKIKEAVSKSAQRVLVKLTDKDFSELQNIVENELSKFKDNINVSDIHLIVENALDKVNSKVAKSYREYRNYKQDYHTMLERVIDTANRLQDSADHSNANADSELVSTKRTLIYKALSKEIYRKFFLNEEELQAIDDGYIYIHDLGDRSTTMNCCLFDMGKVLQNGFDMEGMHYNEPNSISSAINVLCDVMQMAGGAQYGGFTVPEIDSVLEPYVEKSHRKYIKEYKDLAYDLVSEYKPEEILSKANEYAINKVKRDLEQGFQSLEYNLNTVASSRGDFIFTTLTFGLDDRPLAKLVSETILKVRGEGQGKEGFKKPAIFPKLVFLYDKELHSKDKALYDLFLKAIECSSKAQYPDYLSLSGEGYVSSVYKKYVNYQKRWYLGEDNKVKENPNWVDCIISPNGLQSLFIPLL